MVGGGEERLDWTGHREKDRQKDNGVVSRSTKFWAFRVIVMELLWS